MTTLEIVKSRIESLDRKVNSVKEIEASIQFDRFKWMAENLEQLRGLDLACFCSPSSPCHADALIELLS